MIDAKVDILITGASGFLGSHLLSALLASGCSVVAVGRREPIIQSEKIRWLECDFTQRGFAEALPPARTVIHLAQSERFRDFPAGASDVFQVNTASTAALLDYAYRSRVERFLLASSGGVYGHGDIEFTEDHPPSQGSELGYYLASKTCAELLVDSYRSQFITQILRFFFVYGPGQQPSMLIPRLIGRIRAGEVISLSGSDGIRLNPIYVSDAVVAIQSAMKLKESQKINVAGADVVTLRELCETIGSIIGRAPVFEILDQSAHHLVGKTEKMFRELESPVVRIRSGLEKLLSSLA